METCQNLISLMYSSCQLFNDDVSIADDKIYCQAETSPDLSIWRKQTEEIKH
jgi:hypothetical protein